MRDATYRALQDVWSAWLRRRLARDFAGVARFCLFVGYPRSGHSLVGAMLNAHPDAVVSHELDVVPLILAGRPRDEVFARIVARARWFHLRGDRSNYDYRVPGQWQGRHASLRMIGDKRGGAVTRAITSQPDFLDRVRRLVGVPLRVIHVVRNPFDNIAAISIWERLSLEESVRFYFAHARTTARLGALCGSDELLTVRHEDMLDDPRRALLELCAFLGLEPEPSWVEACASIVFPQATRTRRKASWTPALIEEVERGAAEHPHLSGYGYADDAAGGSMRTKFG